MITYYTPSVFQGVGVSVFHNNFLTNDLSFGNKDNKQKYKNIN